MLKPLLDISHRRQNNHNMLLSSVEEGMPWPQVLAGVVRPARVSNHPALAHCHVKTSQAFTPSLSKEGTFLSAPFTYVALYVLFLLLPRPLFPQEPTPRAPSSPPAVVPVKGTLSSYILGPDDLIIIRALKVEELSEKPVRIGTDGIISLPLVGRLQAAGLTVEQLEKELKDRLDPFVEDPQVAVMVTEFKSQPVSVIGSVGSPGVVQLQGRKTLIEVLVLAGGLRSDAGYSAKITRRKENGPIPLPTARPDPTGQFTLAEVNLKKVMAAENPEENILIQPNDVISVPRAELVYVIGDVHRSGGFVLNDEETVSVLRALAMAEGLGGTAKPQKAAILRSAPGAASSRLQIPVDLKKIMAGQAGDVAMKSDDILFVPGSAFKKHALQLLMTAVSLGSGIAIWTHY